jgi:hypothetical protein
MPLLRAKIGEIDKMSQQQYYLQQWRLESFSSQRQGTYYTISLKSTGDFECGCPAWTFQRKRRGECKHIGYVREHYAEEIEQLLNPVTTRRQILASAKRTVTTSEYSIEMLENASLRALMDSL